MTVKRGLWRVWIALSGLYVVVALFGVYDLRHNDASLRSLDFGEYILVAVAIIMLPPLFVLGAAATLAWIVRGFRGEAV